MNRFLLSTFFILSLGLACSDQPTNDFTSEGNMIIIESGNVFFNQDITAASGGTVSIINRDEASHTVTSQSGTDQFDPTGTFDVIAPAQSTQSFTLPETDSGTIFYFYCRFHTHQMIPATGTITIE